MNDEWYERAACRGEPVETFVYAVKPVPEGTKGMSRKVMNKIERALDFCSRCTVVDECLQDMVDQGDTGWRNKIRGGIRLWTDEFDDLPETTVSGPRPYNNPTGTRST